jgi:hypothetical protein
MIFDDILGLVGNVESWAEGQWHQRVVQISVYSGLVFYLLSNKDVFGFVERTLPFKVPSGSLPIFHAVVAGLAMYFGTRFVLDPLMKRITDSVHKAGQVGAEKHAVESFVNRKAAAKRGAKKPIKRAAPKRR